MGKCLAFIDGSLQSWYNNTVTSDIRKEVPVKPTTFCRDLPDGSKQYFEDRIERPSSDQLYYDDILSKPPRSEESGGLEFLFFGKEQSYPNRAILHRKTQEYILHYVTGGKGTYNGRAIGAGDGFLVVPEKPHVMVSDKEDPWQFKWISFRGSDARRQMKALGLDEEHLYFTFSFANRLEELIDDALYRDHGDCDLNTYMQGVFYIILSYHKQEYLNSISKKNTKQSYTQRAMSYIDEHYGEAVRVDEIAQHLHISRKYLCAVFKQETGLSTKDHLLNRRTEVAADLLLNTEMSVSEIAAEVGYADYTQFSRMFRKKKGCSPREFAKRHKHPLDT